MSIISRHESLPGTYTLQTELWLPRKIREVFDFFADAHRLEEITPPWLHFHVLTPKPVPMFAGTTIDYTLRLHGIPLRWQSEIGEWEPPNSFVDRQLRGPYRLWHHRHTFEERDGGTLVMDRVDYAVPGGPLVHWLAVKRDLERIFAFRHQKLVEILGQPSNAVV